MKRMYFTDHKDYTQCFLCPNACRIEENHRGVCLARGREGGTLKLYNYGVVVAANLDPIEKKPLYHFYPGSFIFSVGSYGCNLKCRFCQNCDISQNIISGRFIPPEELVAIAIRNPQNIGVAFTYNEPGIWFEYIIECAPLLKEKGLKIVLVTNGYLSSEPWLELCKVSDAMNIDLKAFTDEFYKSICSGKIAPILKNIEMAVKNKVHVELTNLVVTNLNDSRADFKQMVEWISSISDSIPLHISRYFPRHLETAPETDVSTLEEFFDIAKEKLSYVYLGNVFSVKGNTTECPKCGKTWIRRVGYRIMQEIKGTTCSCGYSIPIPGN